MPHEQIELRGKLLYLHKAIKGTEFNSPTVLTKDPWSYVDLWLRRKNCTDARLYWEQARQFYKATQGLNLVAAPLTIYYSILNATKALLLVKGQQFTDRHGLSGVDSGESTSLTDEKVKIKNTGISGALRRYLGDRTGTTCSLKDILYNLPHIHRAYTLTYPAEEELFYPLKSPRYVVKTDSNEAWFCAEIEGSQYQKPNILLNIGPVFERDQGLQKSWTVRKKRGRFHWDSSDASTSLGNLEKYHSKIRRDVVYIYGSTRLWYIKNLKARCRLADHTLSLMFAAIHRLSELSRYSPNKLEQHLSCDHNWLLQEFISLSLDQYVDEISSEITGQDFMTVGLRAQ